MISDTQAVKYETGIIKFTIYGNQIQVPFKIYAGTECLLKKVNFNKGKYTKVYQKHIPNSIGAKLVCVDNTFFLDTIIYTGKDCINKFIQWIFKMKGYCNQLINNYFNEKLQMSLDNEERYQNSQICWICKEKLDTDKKRDFTELPPKECFYSSIKDGKRDNDNSHISNKKYLHLKNVWSIFNFNTFRVFHNLCLKKRCIIISRHI